MAVLSGLLQDVLDKRSCLESSSIFGWS